VQDSVSSLFSERPSFTLPNFEGPLELLLYLVQKEEVDVCEIFLKHVTEQFSKELESAVSVDHGAEFLSIATTLLLMKSRKLLPVTEGTISEDEEADPRFQIIQQLLDYCRFRDIAEGLSEREEQQKTFFARGVPLEPKRISPGLEEVHLEDLAGLLQDLLRRAEKKPSLVIRGEEWQVAPKIQWLKNEMEQGKRYNFDELFSFEKTRGELVVLFLALLELMKHQQACVYREDELLYIQKPHNKIIS